MSVFGSRLRLLLAILCISCSIRDPLDYQDDSFSLDSFFDDPTQSIEPLLMPTGSSLFHLKETFIMADQVRIFDIKKCKSFLANLPPLSSEDQLIQARETLLKLMTKKDIKEFHWCFLEELLNLALKLEATEPTLSEKKTYLSEHTLKIWVIARALDTQLGVQRYYPLLQERYLLMQQSTFGHHLKIETLPGL